jgi:hypothetical protein
MHNELTNLDSIKRETEAQSISANPGIWRHIFLRKSLDGILFPKLRMGEDQVFLGSFYSLGPKVLELKTPIYSYWTGGNSHLTTNRMAIRELPRANELMKKLVQKQESRNKEMLEQMYVRQVITILTKLSLKTSAGTILSFLLLIARKPHLFLTGLRVVFRTVTSHD